MNSIYDAQAIKKVQSVLEKNVDIRNRMLMINKGKYSQYDGIFVPSIGEYYQIHGFKGITDITGGRSLTEYTYDDKGEYGSKIISDNSLGNIKQYSVTNDKIFRRNRYNNFENGDYLSYVDSVYGQNDAAVTFIESLIQGVNPEYAMRATEVGVVRDLRVNSALNGIVTTNPNYREGDKIVNLIDIISSSPFDFDAIKNIAINDTDTRIGVIANGMYSNSLYYAATVNTARGRNRTSEHPYLTPYLFEEYGNNLSTINKLSDILWVDQKYGRTRNDLGNDIGIMKFSDVHPQNNGAWKEIADQFSNEGVIYAPLNGLGYANVINGKVENEKFDGIDTRVNIREYVGTIDKRKPLHFVHDELDNAGVRSRQTIKTDDNGEPLYDEDFEEESFSTVGLIQEEFDTYFPLYDGMVRDNNLLAKTKKMFDSHKINTMMARFHTAENGEPSNDSAYDRTYGNAHGRSLKILDADKKNNRTNGYSNPYCRTWTYHHEYDRYSRAIRPFVYDDNGIDRPWDIAEIQNSVSEFRSHITNYTSHNVMVEKGGEYLAKYTVLQNNGFARIAPTIQDYYESTQNGNNSMYNYMLSIENLAWKDFPYGIESNRRGPNGGRIMWFPPYDINFQENVGVEWNENAFIGRGEKVYTYANTTREATLGFTILIDHPSIVDKLRTYEGVGEDKDPDSDILRFFAGCQPFEFPEEDEENDPLYQESEPIEEPKPTVNDGGVIKFAVFFPNNYSGNGTEITKSEWEHNGYSDGDWWKYLLCGHNVTVDENNSSDWVGYETSSRGVSDIQPVPITDESKFIYACANNANANFKKCDRNNTDPRRRFRYRVDFDLRQHALHYDKNNINNDSYVDSVSKKYNISIDSVKNNTNGHFSSNTHTFGEVFAALDFCANDGRTMYDRVLSLGGRDGEIGHLIDIFDTMSINKVVVKGGATQQDSANSSALSNRRAKTVGTTLKQIISSFNSSDVKVSYDSNFVFNNGEENLNGNKNINSDKAKYQRCVQVEIYYSEQSIETNGNDITGTTDNDISAITEDNASVTTNSTNRIVWNRKIGEQSIITDSDLEGYEYDYFSRLEVDDPFVFKRIKDKFKYFDPAFHSMSPEGFNARLNFLQQCTRQGHTLSASEVNGTTGNVAPTAGNLAFGRMPVCILKIGDFINSRMIIRSMSIVYSNDGMQWDLNPEGIGVQPIFAKVTLGIVLLGGSALNMPVNRLQNAQTFDYYANTGVYDNRADRVEIDNSNVRGGTAYKWLYNPKQA